MSNLASPEWSSNGTDGPQLRQIYALSESHNGTDDRYVKSKQENAHLLAKVYTLEEQLLELEIESDEKRKEVERRHKEALQRHEREKNLEIDQCMSKIFSLQQELSEERKKTLKQQTVIDKLEQEKQLLEDQIQEKNLEMEQMEEEVSKIKEKVRYLKDEDKANKRVIEVLNQELLELRKCYGLPDMNGHGNGPVNGTCETDGTPLTNGGVTNGFRYSNHRSSSKESLLREARIYNEFEEEMKKLRSENQGLRDANEELQAQLLNSHLEEGRSLLKQGAQVSSLAEELRNLSNDELKSALREQQECNAKLRAYIDGILLNIVENYPQLLEVKPKSS